MGRSHSTSYDVNFGSVKLLQGYLSLQVLAFSISFCCLHHLDLFSLCLLHSSNSAAIKHISAAILQHTKQNSSNPVACKHTPTPADWTAGLPRPLCIDVKFRFMHLGVHAQLIRCNYSCNNMLGMPCLCISSKHTMVSMRCCMTSFCVAEQQQEACLILDAALISFIAALTR